MNIVSLILPILTLIIGFFLSEFGKIISGKRKEVNLNRKKFKKLIFFLLELRFIISRSNKVAKLIERYIASITEIIYQKYQVNFPAETKTEMMNLLEVIIQEVLPQNDEVINFLEKNIDEILLTISEIDPVFAYELKGHYNIKERIQAGSKYFEEMQKDSNVTLDIKKLFEEPITEDLLNDLKDHTLSITGKVSKKLLHEVKSKIDQQDQTKFDDDEVNLIVEKYLSSALVNIIEDNK